MKIKISIKNRKKYILISYKVNTIKIINFCNKKNKILDKKNKYIIDFE
jgi:hypothetical protein